MTRQPPYWPHRCSICARYVGNIRIRANDDRMTEARGTCHIHGDVDLGRESWDWDLYEWQEAP
jgi:hypothetical protein